MTQKLLMSEYGLHHEVLVYDAPRRVAEIQYEKRGECVACSAPIFLVAHVIVEDKTTFAVESLCAPSIIVSCQCANVQREEKARHAHAAKTDADT